MKRGICSILWLVSGLAAAAAVAGPPYDAIYAFGDSLTDTGNEPAEPLAHYQGRWSNGPLWIEYLSQRFGFAYNPGNNFAHSGAQCDDTYIQVTNFHPAADLAQSLFVVWAGGNDFLQEYDNLGFDNAAWNRQIAYSVGNLSNAVVNLQGKGARFILVPNTVDLTEIPTLNYLPGFLRAYLRGKVQQFDSELDAALDGLQAAFPDLKLFRCDTFAAEKAILASAAAYGFTEWNIDALADARLLDKSFDGPGANYVFWDPVHPTTKTHAIVADWFHAAVAPMHPRLALKRDGAPLELACSQLHVTRNYTLQRTTDLTTWDNVQTFLCITPGQMLKITNEVPHASFRLNWTPSSGR
jgi:phospholipase/lecithinase/hemolysin